MSNLSSRVAFATGTGRCGTKFISEILGREKNVSSCHERNPLNETFHRYSKWNNLDIDDLGFLTTKQREIENDLLDNAFSFEASAHLALSISELYAHFKCKFILFIRSPEAMINSYIKKRVYYQPIVRSDHDKALGYQDLEKFHQFLGRIVPRDRQTFQKWATLSQAGKLAWWWKTINTNVLRQFERIPDDSKMIQKIEEFDYNKYLELLRFLKLDTQISERAFNKLVEKKPNSFKKQRRSFEWNNQDRSQLMEITSDLAGKFGYDMSEISLSRLNSQ